MRLTILLTLGLMTIPSIAQESTPAAGQKPEYSPYLNDFPNRVFFGDTHVHTSYSADATTGTRIQVRVFGGFDFVEGDEYRPSFAEYGYEKGVPMGGDLKSAPEGKAPGLVIDALKDVRNANLDRIQVIKGWTDAAGELHERIYDVAVSDGRRIGEDGRCRESVQNTVSVEDATYSNRFGAPALNAYWRATRISTRNSVRSTTSASSKSRPRAGPPTTRRSTASKSPRKSPTPSRNAPTLRRSGILPDRRFNLERQKEAAATGECQSPLPRSLSTVFIGCERSSMPNANDLHLDIIFRDGGDKVRRVAPFSQYDSFDREDLYKWMQEYAP